MLKDRAKYFAFEIFKTATGNHTSGNHSEMPFTITNIVYTFHFYHLLFVLLHEKNHSLSLNLYMLLVSFNLLKISENQRSSDVFRRNRKRAMTSNGLILRRMVSLEINLGKLLVSVLLKRQNRS